MTQHSGSRNGSTRGADVVARFAAQLGRGTAFGVPGSSMVSVLHAFQSSDTRFIPALHESAAIAMADGYARIAGPTAAFLYMLPGTLNGLGNLYNAWRDETPVIVMASQQASEYRALDASVGEGELSGLARDFTRFSWEVRHPDQLASSLNRAVRLATGVPTGPAFVSLPEDVLTSEAASELTHEVVPAEHAGSPNVSDIARRLLRAERPLVVAGGQVRRYGGSALLEKLATELAIPVAMEPYWNDRLAIAPGHPFSVGPLTERSPFARDADFVLVIGSRYFNEVHPIGRDWFPAGCYVAHVNADPAKLRPSYPADWSCAADPAVVLQALLMEISGQVDTARHAARNQKMSDLRARWSKRSDGGFDATIRAIAPALDYGYLVDESVSGNYPLTRSLQSMRGDRYISTSGGSLGWGAGAAAGVAIASGEPVVCVLGDGAFFFGLQSLWTASSMSLPITYVVLDNHGFGSTRWFEEQYVKTLPADAPRAGYIGSDFREGGPSVAAAARGFGINAIEVSGPEQLSEALQRRWHSEAAGPQLIVTPIAFDA